MSSKIEPGCLCILVNCAVPENNGKCVTAVYCIGPQTFYGPDRKGFRDIAWKIDPPMLSWKGRLSDECRQSSLLRIDGYTPSTSTTHEKEKEHS